MNIIYLIEGTKNDEEKWFELIIEKIENQFLTSLNEITFKEKGEDENLENNLLEDNILKRENILKDEQKTFLFCLRTIINYNEQNEIIFKNKSLHSLDRNSEIDNMLKKYIPELNKQKNN